MNKDQITIIEALMKKTPAVALTSICEDGYPRTVSMANIKSESVSTVWFATGLNSNKVKHFIRDPRASVCYNVDGHNITLIGEVHVVDNAEIKRELWLDWFIDHFPLGIEDPNYCILKFVAKRVSVWMGDLFGDFDLE